MVRHKILCASFATHSLVASRQSVRVTNRSGGLDVNRHIVLVMVALLLTLNVLPSFAQTAVYVGATAPDSVGHRFTYSIREGIRRSAGLSLADREQDGFIRVYIVTLDPDANTASSGNRTIYSVVWTMRTLHDTPVTMYLTNSVGVCGSQRVSQSADDIVAKTDNWASEIRGWFRTISENSKK